MPDAQEPRFEVAIDQLEQLIDQIESGEIGLEDALQRYEDGARLIRHCRSILDTAERKIAELTIEEGGEVSAADDLDDDDLPGGEAG
jgi:exodeoxyribonuclease VII small subunit